jgi:cytochrome c oxidase subunit 2
VRRAWLPLLLLATGCSAGAPTKTEQGQEFRDLWSIFLVIAVLVVALIWGLVLWCIVRYRRRPDDDGLPNQGGDRPKLELTYTIIPLLVVAVLFTLSVVAERRVSDPSDEPDLLVDVEAYRWDWRFTYTDADVQVVGTDDEVPVLVLPVDRTIRFELRTADVIHSFWVPEFGTKQDMIPKVENHIDITITDPGTWTGRCAEYCGLDHADMRFEVRAVPADEFDDWLAGEAAA